MNRVAVHGLEIESDLALAGWPPNCDADVDVRVTWLSQAPIIRSAAVAGRISPPAYSIHRTETGFTVAVPGVARLVATADEVRVFPEQPRPGQIESLVEGMALSLVLDARGELPLHASAISIEERTVAVAGASGSGKSTLAGLLCAGGARLVSDDVLRVTRSTNGCECYAGTARLRLRSRVRAIAALLPKWQASETHDGRLALAPPGSPPSPRPLDAIVIPSFKEAPVQPELLRLRGIDSVAALLGAPRIPGWTDHEVQSRYHRHLAHVARTVPVFVVRLPRMPFDAASAATLFELIRNR